MTTTNIIPPFDLTSDEMKMQFGLIKTYGGYKKFIYFYNSLLYNGRFPTPSEIQIIEDYAKELPTEELKKQHSMVKQKYEESNNTNLILNIYALVLDIIRDEIKSRPDYIASQSDTYEEYCNLQ